VKAYYAAEMHRLRGELLLRVECGVRGVALTPEACFQKVLSIARSQQAKALELRAATSLVRLWQSQGKRQDAYELLAPVNEWFEGFNMADL
jgi:predicted ATPase